MTLTRDEAKKFLGLPEQAFQYYLDTGRLEPLPDGAFDEPAVKALQAQMQLFGISTAAAYLGMTAQNLKWHTHVAGNIHPVLRGKSLVFTRQQLDDFKAHGRTDIIPALGHLYSADEAASYLGLSPSAFGWHVRQRAVKGDVIGRSILYNQAELDKFEGEGIMRSPSK